MRFYCPRCGGRMLVRRVYRVPERDLAVLECSGGFRVRCGNWTVRDWLRAPGLLGRLAGAIRIRRLLRALDGREARERALEAESRRRAERELRLPSRLEEAEIEVERALRRLVACESQADGGPGRSNGASGAGKRGAPRRSGARTGDRSGEAPRRSWRLPWALSWGAILALSILWGGSAAACDPDPRYSPTPTFAWDPPADDPLEANVSAYRLRWRWYDPEDPAPGWSVSCCQVTLPCELRVDEDTGSTWKRCPRGGSIPPDAPLQRWTNAAGDLLEVCVSPIDLEGVEGECSLADVDDEVEGVQSVFCAPPLRRF